MPMARRFWSVLFAFAWLGTQSALAADSGRLAALASAERLSEAFAAVASQVIPSVVNISAKSIIPGRSIVPPFFPIPEDLRALLTEPPEEVHSLGSGVIIRSDGYVLTNLHVVRRAQEITVGLADGRRLPARVVAIDGPTDLAILRVRAGDLPPITWGDSDALRVGEWVLAIGSPLGLSHSVTAGIVSAKGRCGLGITGYEDFIQTDAAINPGNSGGALVNLRAEVVGINTAIISRTGGYEGIGFATPSNLARRVADLLIAKGRIVRGWLGILPMDVTEEIAAELGLPVTSGVLVRNIYRDSPAHRAGFHAGDVIVAYRGRPVQNSAELARMVMDTPVGSVVQVAVVRAKVRIILRPRIGELPLRPDGYPWPGL